MDILTFPDYFHEAKVKEFMISMLTFQKKKEIGNYKKCLPNLQITWTFYIFHYWGLILEI